MTLTSVRRRANRVLAGTQTGRYKKHEMARDIQRLIDIAEAARDYLYVLDSGRLADDAALREALENFTENSHSESEK